MNLNLLQNIPNSDKNYKVSQLQGYTINNELFSEMKYIKDYPQDVLRQKNFANGLQNARNILSDLQESLDKTKKYEDNLMRCRSSHPHSHVNEWWGSDHEGNDKKCTKTDELFDTEPLRNGVLTESWSTMSLVCLQYQYEELSKRYKSLLEAYDERCRAACAKDAQLAQLQDLAKDTQAQLLNALRSVIAVGEKYLAMRQRKRAQKIRYSNRVRILKSKVESLLVKAERAWQELDDRLATAMKTERQGATALLLAEMRKYNSLCLENLHLKTRIHALTSQDGS